MAQDLQHSFEELIPGAGDKADTFLNVIFQESQKHDLGLTLVPKVIRKTQQAVLEASIQLGGALFRGAPMKLVVFAEPVASSLQVGWQLTESQGSSALSMVSERYAYSVAKVRERNLKPENQRKLTGMVMGFHQLVFLPVMHMLIDAMEQSARPQGGVGFLGAN